MGLVAGGAFVVGALVGWFVRVPQPQRLVASVMAFGAGVLISALAFDFVDEAERGGGLTATAIGFLAGASSYVAANPRLMGQRVDDRSCEGLHPMLPTVRDAMLRRLETLPGTATLGRVRASLADDHVHVALHDEQLRRFTARRRQP